MAMLIVERSRGDFAAIATRGAGWRAWYRVDQIQRLYWRLGFVAGVVCLAVAGIAAVVS
jgi:hypothetical protein